MKKNKATSISIITPSFNMLPYLKLAAASIADQKVPENCMEHIVVDGGSSDGTKDWLANTSYPHLKSICEPDEGMYDAINKGLKQAKGDIIAYLNCDEQYLPGTFERVSDFFDSHPDIDMIFGNALLTRPDGSLIAFRKGYQPRYHFILTSHLYVLSCTMFFRRRIIEDGYFFDTQYRAVGDMDFVLRLLSKGYKAKHLRCYLSVFTMTGNNLSSDQKAVSEQQILMRSAPVYLRALKPFINILRLSNKFLSGAYFQGGPIDYQLYTREDILKRKAFHIEKASSKWKHE